MSESMWINARIVDFKYMDVYDEGKLWPVFTLRRESGVLCYLVISRDVEGNGPGSFFIEGVE